MAKMALCIKHPGVMPADGMHALFASPIPLLPVELVDREVCEDPENGFLQLIPYISVTDQEDNVYIYHRGAAGDEARLHAKLSIGLGGHIDRMPAEAEPLMALFQAEGARELREEAGITPKHPIQFTHILVDTSDDVGRVHLGVFGVYQIDNDEKAAMVTEKNVIEHGQFATVEALKNEYRTRLENWSRILVDYVEKV